jgi:hypothetical protein
MSYSRRQLYAMGEPLGDSATYRKVDGGLVLGGGGFIGNAMVTRLKKENYWVRSVDLKHPEFSTSDADEFLVGDLRDVSLVESVINLNNPIQSNGTFDEIYQFAADMGGAGFVFTGDHDAEIMHNSATINLNVLEALRQLNEKLNVKPVDASIYHYGWVKEPEVMQKKIINSSAYWHSDQWIEKNIAKDNSFDYLSIDQLELFKGTHPKVMQKRVEEKNWEFDYDISFNKVTTKERLKKWLYKYLGINTSYRNYKLK